MWPKKKKPKDEVHRRITKEVVTPAKDPTSIGNLLVSAGFVEQPEFDTLCDEFQSTSLGTLLGQFFVAKDFITQDQLDWLLVRQRKLRDKSGEISHENLMELMDIAGRTHYSVARELDALNTIVQAAVAKTENGSKK